MVLFSRVVAVAGCLTLVQLVQLKTKLQAKEEEMQSLQAELSKALAEVYLSRFLTGHRPDHTLMSTLFAALQTARLSKERETLVRNISCLFKTAQMEIQRKDAELKQLREK